MRDAVRRSLIRLAVTVAAGAILSLPARAGDKEDCRNNASADTSIAACTRLIDSPESSPTARAEALLDRGNARVRLRQVDEAIADYDAALAADPKYGLAHNNRALAWRRKGDLDKALADFDAAIKLMPRYAFAYQQRALTHAQKGNLDLAVADYGEAIKLNPKDASAYAGRAAALEKKGATDGAIADLGEAITLDGKPAPHHAARAALRQKKGDVDGAIADYDAAIEFDPANTRLLLARAAIRRDRKELAQEIADLDQVIKAEPDNAIVYGLRATAHFGARNRDLALADLGQVIRLKPNDIQGYMRRARQLHGLQDRAAAIADYEQVLRLDPKYDLANFWLGVLHSLNHDYDKAIAAHARMIANRPELPDGYRNRGIAFRDKGDFERAVTDFDTVLRLAPTDGNGLIQRGRAYELKGEFTRAAADYNAVLSLPLTLPGMQRHHDDARNRLATLKQKETALEAARKAASAPPPPGYRVALVIGNSAYKNVPALANARRDAEAMAATFRAVGFKTVMVQMDATNAQLHQTLQAFTREALKAEWAVVYYAGHGVEVGGANYLVPVDAKLKSDNDVFSEAVSLDQVKGSIELARKLRLVMLDACRDNPFTAQMLRAKPKRTIGSGLGEPAPDGGTLIAYATKDGEVALDGTGKNSPFVTALAKRLPEPNVEVNRLFRLVRDDVLTATERRQEPYVYGSLPDEDFFFVRR